METKLAILCLVVCATCAQYVPPSLPSRPGRQKPGTCPVSTIITTCECRPEFIRCNSDRDCPGTPPRGICSMPEDDGLCLAAIPRWWYNRLTNQCQSFIYGGCGGNQNNFETLIECENRCRRNSYRPG